MAVPILSGAIFHSYDELKLFISQYSETNNVDIHIQRSRTLNAARKTCPAKVEKANPDLKYYCLDYRCIHGGVIRKRGLGLRNTKTFNINCPFRIRVTLSSDGLFLQVSEFNENHNHEVSEELYRLLPSQRRLPEDVQKEAVFAMQLQVKKKFVRDKIRQETNKMVTSRDLTNLAIKAKAAQKRWKSIKDSYLKYVKDEKGKGGDDNKPKRPYLYHRQMSFLQSVSEPKEPSENMPEEFLDSAVSVANDIEIELEPTGSNETTTQMPQKRKNDNIEQEIADVHKSNERPAESNNLNFIHSYDPDEMFLLSQLPAIKALSAAQKMDFQIKFIQLLQTYN